MKTPPEKSAEEILAEFIIDNITNCDRKLLGKFKRASGQEQEELTERISDELGFSKVYKLLNTKIENAIAKKDKQDVFDNEQTLGVFLWTLTTLLDEKTSVTRGNDLSPTRKKEPDNFHTLQSVISHELTRFKTLLDETTRSLHRMSDEVKPARSTKRKSIKDSLKARRKKRPRTVISTKEEQEAVNKPPMPDTPPSAPEQEAPTKPEDKQRVWKKAVTKSTPTPTTRMWKRPDMKPTAPVTPEPTSKVTKPLPKKPVKAQQTKKDAPTKVTKPLPKKPVKAQQPPKVPPRKDAPTKASRPLPEKPVNAQQPPKAPPRKNAPTKATRPLPKKPVATQKKPTPGARKNVPMSKTRPLPKGPDISQKKPQAPLRKDSPIVSQEHKKAGRPTVEKRRSVPAKPKPRPKK